MTAQAPRLADLPNIDHAHMSGAVSSYGTRHLQALFGALGRLARAPLATLLTLIVIGVALALPAGLALVVNNLRAATGDLSNAVDFTVHFKLGTPHRTRASRLAKGARERPGIDSVTVTTADAGARGIQAGLGLRRCAGGARGQSAAASPRPCGRRRTPAVPPRWNPCAATSRRFPKSRSCSSTSTGCGGCIRCSTCCGASLWVVIAVLGLGVLAVIGNTIRLEIQQRRPEIEVTKLVGGSNAFVRRPFLYTGLFYGLGGALLAALIVFGGMAYLDQAVRELSAQYGGRFRLAGLGGRGLGHPGWGRARSSAGSGP